MAVNYNEMVLFFEITDMCNARCIMCGAQSVLKKPHGIKKGFMSFSLFKKIVNSIEKSRIRPPTVVFTWLGESVLHPEFPEFMSYILSKPVFNDVQFNTNGIGLTKEIIDVLLSCEGLTRIHFSLDAASPYYFKKIKKIEGFDKVLHNINYFLKKRGQRKLPIAIFAFIVMEENKKEALNFLNFFKNLLKKYNRDYIITYDCVRGHEKDAIVFSRCICNEQSKADRLHKEVVKSLGIPYQVYENGKIWKTQALTVENRFLKKPIFIDSFSRKPCAALWKMPNICHDGTLTVCCHDIFLELKLGNLKYNDFYDLWWGEKADKIRKAHLIGNLDDYELCKSCGNIEHFFLSEEEIESEKKRLLK